VAGSSAVSALRPPPARADVVGRDQSASSSPAPHAATTLAGLLALQRTVAPNAPASTPMTETASGTAGEEAAAGASAASSIATTPTARPRPTTTW
jgi:hypothetical protein